VLKAFFRIRYMVAIAVLAGLLGALLMLLIGGWNIIEAFLIFLGVHASEASGNANLEAVVKVIEAVDRFLLAFVLLYFAYSSYFLFVHDEIGSKILGDIPMPEWLVVEDLGQMKKVLLEVILVLIAVYLLQVIFLEGIQLTWETLILPASILVIAVSLRLVHFD
jgi:uncharacterized membrane protein YqhA